MDDALLEGRRERRSVSQPLAPEGLGKRWMYDSIQFKV